MFAGRASHRRRATQGAPVLAALVAVGSFSGSAQAIPVPPLTGTIAVARAAQAAGAVPSPTTPLRNALPVARAGATATGPRRHLPISRRIPQAPSLRSAGPFLIREIHEMTRGHWLAAWRNLYPAHQQIAPLNIFVPCERATPFPAPLQGISVLNVSAAAVRVPGTAGPVDGAAVTVHVELTWFGPRDPITLDHTFHVVPVDGQWTWLLSETSYQAFHDGACAA